MMISFRRAAGAFRLRAAGFFKAHGWMAAAIAGLLICTRGYTMGDTPYYAGEIGEYLGRSPLGPGNRLWEFGHLLWRPLAWLLLTLTKPLMDQWTNWDAATGALFVLICLCMVSGAINALLFHSIALRLTPSRRTAFLVAIGFACANSSLTYTHSGTAYVPGMLCISLAAWLLVRAWPPKAPADFRVVCCCGLLVALASLLWFPFVLSAPGICFLLIWRSPSPPRIAELIARPRLKSMLGFLAVFVLCLTLAYGAAVAARQISSLSEARASVADSSHGWAQNRTLLRLGTGVPRSFLYMNDGLLFKRFLFHDPFAPVTFADLVRGSLWKIAVVAAFGICLLWQLLRSSAKWEMALLAAGVIPTVLFAVLVFEPGSPERYMPAYPFLMIVVARVLRKSPRPFHFAQWIVAAFLVCMPVTNIYAMYRPRIDREDAVLRTRFAAVKSNVPDGDLVANLFPSMGETFMLAHYSFLEPRRRPGATAFYSVIEPGSRRVRIWREEFARVTLQVWSRGGNVWVSKWVVAERPLPDWGWVEGDNALMLWRNIYDFFTSLEPDEQFGDADGFVRIKQSERNTQMLNGYALKLRQNP
jgi:hypothetical protein